MFLVLSANKPDFNKAKFEVVDGPYQTIKAAKQAGTKFMKMLDDSAHILFIVKINLELESCGCELWKDCLGKYVYTKENT